MSAPLAHEWWDAAYAADLSDLDRRYRVRARAVLVALARHANPEGRCWPSAARLASLTELAERTVGHALADLVSLQLIERERRHRPTGFRSSDEYRLRLDLTAATAGRRGDLTAATAPSQGAATAEQNGSGGNGPRGTGHHPGAPGSWQPPAQLIDHLHQLTGSDHARLIEHLTAAAKRDDQIREALTTGDPAKLAEHLTDEPPDEVGSWPRLIAHRLTDAGYAFAWLDSPDAEAVTP